MYMNFDSETKQFEQASEVVRVILMCGCTPNLNILMRAYPGLSFSVTGKNQKVKTESGNIKLKFIADKAVITGKTTDMSITLIKENVHVKSYKSKIRGDILCRLNYIITEGAISARLALARACRAIQPGPPGLKL